jgi:hypothetical protein
LKVVNGGIAQPYELSSFIVVSAAKLRLDFCTAFDKVGGPIDTYGRRVAYGEKKVGLV